MLGALSEHTPAPGAGSAVAWSGALAAALLEMVARYAGVDEVAGRAGVLRRELTGAGERELHAYEPVLAATTQQEREEALSAASEVPLAIARASTEVAELAATVTAQSKPALKGDGAAALLLAEAAAAAAARLVQINLAAMPGDPRLEEVARLTERAARARESALAHGT